ncbi:MAG TPA: F0F1 ATP synthase subunit A [Thermomicrobiales bacterium]|nr:F0F1 ATP synthase subunit A [Thermomicrobiales bacterium]
MEIHVSVKPETLWSVGPLDITNSFFTMIIVMVVLIVAGAIIARSASIDRPGKVQSAAEVVVEFLQNLVYSTAGRRAGQRIFPLVGGLFFFIIVSNYAGLLPGVGTIGLWDEHEEEATSEESRVASAAQAGGPEVVYAAQEEEAEHDEKVLSPFLRSPSADLNMTLAMALLTFVIVQFAGVAAHGIGGRIKHMADPWWIFPIELISEVSRIISLSFRLFGNIFAGEVLVAVMIAMSRAMLVKFYVFPLIALPTVFLFLEVLFGFIQALVFALLTLIYIALAAAGHDDHEEEHAHGDLQTAPAAGSAGD